MRQKAGGENPLAPAEGTPRRAWLPLTRELSPQATEGENLQSVCSEHPASQQARSISPSVKPFGLATSLVRGRQDGGGSAAARALSLSSGPFFD